MSKFNCFVINNESQKDLTLNIEPEGHFFLLSDGQEVVVRDEYTAIPMTIRVNSNNDGEPILSIWPGDGKVKVEQDGVDVLDIM